MKVVLLYHLVFPTKYHRLVIDDNVYKSTGDICLEIAKRYEMHFIEVGTDNEHVHFLVRSVHTLTITSIVTITKSITARHAFDTTPELKKKSWGPIPWTSGYYASTIGKHGTEAVIGNYVKEQGCATDYIQIHKDQLRLL